LSCAGVILQVVDENYFKNECPPDRYTATTKNITILQENVDPRSATHFDLMVNSDVIYGSSFVGVLYCGCLVL